MEPDGTDPVQLTNGPGEKLKDVSPDSQWVLYMSLKDSNLWRLPIDGGVPVQVTHSGSAVEASFSPDGKWLIYSTERNGKWTLALMPFEGSEPVRYLDLPDGAANPHDVQWMAGGQSISFIRSLDGVGNIWRMPIDGGPVTKITSFTSDRIQEHAWSHDGRKLAVLRGAWTADLALLTQE